MRPCYVTLPIISISLILISFGIINFSRGQVDGAFQTEDPTLGIKFSHPSDWGPIEKLPILCGQYNCAFSLPAGDASIEIIRATDTRSLKDLVKSIYNVSKDEIDFSFINDNQTTLGKKYPAWQYEYAFTDYKGLKEKALEVVSTYNGSSVTIKAKYPVELAPKILPQFRKLLDSVEITPIQIPKPSFLDANETEIPKPQIQTGNNPSGLQILSHNSYTDSIGFMHVVGEVQNNSPLTASFVKVTGTFYDNNNQVVGTQFTYTNPSDIGAGQKAPFDLILTSASVPVSAVDHYNLVASSQ